MGNGGYIQVCFKFLSVLPCADMCLRPVIGDVLSHSADQWPETLGEIAVFRHYTYFLPCLAAAMVPLSEFVIVFGRGDVNTIA